nr:hypothetical protein [Prevotella sp.]
MKHVKNIITMIALMALPLSFISCDDDDYYDDDWWYNDIGNGFDGSWNNQDWWNEGDENPSSDKLKMADMLAHKWTGTLIAYYYDSNNVQQRDSFEIDLDYNKVSSNAAVGTCTEYSWPIIDGVTSDDEDRKINTYIWYVDDNLDINITYSNGDKCKIDYDDLRLGDFNDGEGTVFDGTMQTEYDGEYYNFWTNLFKTSVAMSKGTRASDVNIHPYKIVFQNKK